MPFITALLIIELLTPAEIVILVLPVIFITPELHTPSPVVVLLLILISLLRTENKVVDGLMLTDHAVVPASDVVPLANVKSSFQKVAVVPPAVTVTACEAVQPLAGLVTVAV